MSDHEHHHIRPDVEASELPANKRRRIDNTDSSTGTTHYDNTENDPDNMKDQENREETRHAEQKRNTNKDDNTTESNGNSGKGNDGIKTQKQSQQIKTEKTNTEKHEEQHSRPMSEDENSNSNNIETKYGMSDDMKHLQAFLRSPTVPEHMTVGQADPVKENTAFTRDAFMALKRELASSVPAVRNAHFGREEAQQVIHSPLFTEFLAWQRLCELRENAGRLYAATQGQMAGQPVVAVLIGDTWRHEMRSKTVVLGRKDDSMQRIMQMGHEEGEGTKNEDKEDTETGKEYRTGDDANGNNEQINNNNNNNNNNNTTDEKTKRKQRLKTHNVNNTQHHHHHHHTNNDDVNRIDMPDNNDDDVMIDVTARVGVGVGDDTVSRRHCAIVLDSDSNTFYLLNYSKNGTVVDDDVVFDQVVPLPLTTHILGMGRQQVKFRSRLKH